MSTLKEYLSSLSVAERGAFAVRCETTYGHLRNVAYGQKPAGEKLCILVERESGGVVRCETLRSDVPWSVLRKSEVTTQGISHV